MPLSKYPDYGYEEQAIRCPILSDGVTNADNMNGFERTHAALRGAWPDTVPVMLHNFMMAAEEAGYTQAAFRSDPERVATSFIEAVERYEYDGIVVDIDTVVLAGAVGVPLDLPVDEPARSRVGCLNELSEVSRIEPVDLENSQRVNVLLESVRRLKQHFGDSVFVRGNCDQAPFSLASQMRSTEKWMMDLLDDDGAPFVEDLLEYCTQVVCRMIGLMAQAGADMISNGDSPAGPAMISPAMYRKFAMPYETRCVREAHHHGLPYALHICGDTTLILDDMLETGTDALELDYLTNIRTAHEVCRDRACFIGNIDPSGVLALGTARDVCRATSDLLSVYSDSPRFILNAGCAIPRTTPSENVRAMIDTARTFSR